MVSRGSVALVTGSASGIGLATVERAGELGYLPVGLDVAERRPDDGPASRAGGCIGHVDVTDAVAIRSAFEDVERTVGSIGVSVAAAGVLGAAADPAPHDFERSTGMTDEGAKSTAIGEVREAYEQLMSAFTSSDSDEYFACFHEDASFLFPGEPLLEPRSAYRSAWSRWRREGVRFTDVVADDVHMRVFGDTAVVMHRITTTVKVGGKTTVDRERESIIFVRTAGRWLAVHEHLSPADT